jgi:hypothetical protein
VSVPAAKADAPFWPAIASLYLAGIVGSLLANVLLGPLAFSLVAGSGAAGTLLVASTLAGAGASAVVLPKLLRAIASLEVSFAEACVVCGARALVGLAFSVLVAASTTRTREAVPVLPFFSPLGFATGLIGLVVASALLRRIARPVTPEEPTPTAADPAWWLERPSQPTAPSHELDRKPDRAHYLALVREAGDAAVQDDPEKLQELAGTLDDLVPPDERARPAQQRLVVALLQLAAGSSAVGDVEAAVREIDSLLGS